jgi:predicted amidohydrolase YtcJ
VLGRGWHYGTFPGAMPDRTILDRMVPDRPALLESFDSHTQWLNSAALSAAGITAATPDPVNGTIERDGAGEPTGILKEFVPETLDAVVPGPTDAQLDALLRDALGSARRVGVTALQEAWTEPRSLHALGRLRDEGALDVRVRVAAVADPSAWPGALAAGRRAFGDALDAFGRELVAIRPDAWLRGGVVKAFADGVVESGTAWMLEPYEGEAADTGGDGAKGPAVHGRPNWSAAALAEMTATAVARGWQVEIHAIGDAAIRAALDAHAQTSVVAGSGAQTRGRIEHVEWPHPADIPRFGELGVLASMQPTHALALPHKHSVREQRIGPRVERGWPWASLLAGGAIVAFGSDWPIATLDPLRQVHAAVTRRDPAHESAEAWLPHQCLTVTQALACATWGSAAAGLAERRRGAIATGMDADLVLLDGDPLSEGAEALVASRVLTTIVAGRVVYRADNR